MEKLTGKWPAERRECVGIRDISFCKENLICRGEQQSTWEFLDILHIVLTRIKVRHVSPPASGWMVVDYLKEATRPPRPTVVLPSAWKLMVTFRVGRLGTSRGQHAEGLQKRIAVVRKQRDRERQLSRLEGFWSRQGVSRSVHSSRNGRESLAWSSAGISTAREGSRSGSCTSGEPRAFFNKKRTNALMKLQDDSLCGRIQKSNSQKCCLHEEKRELDSTLSEYRLGRKVLGRQWEKNKLFAAPVSGGYPRVLAIFSKIWDKREIF